jgi:uncharacterized protein YggT (Ycf19 family)
MTEREYYSERRETTSPAQQTGTDDRLLDELMADGADARRAVSRERVAGPQGAVETRREHVVVPSETARKTATARRIQRVISFVVGTLVVLLAIRFVLLLLGANPASAFVALMYGLTQPLTAPFQGIFGEPTVGASVVEWASIVAMICYGLVGFGLNRLVDVVAKPARPRVEDGETLR